jgi:hypothetical protein
LSWQPQDASLGWGCMLLVLGRRVFEQVEAELHSMTARKVRWQSGFPLTMSCNMVSAKMLCHCSIAVTQPAALILMGKWRDWIFCFLSCGMARSCFNYVCLAGAFGRDVLTCKMLPMNVKSGGIVVELGGCEFMQALTT